jgi:hypothetical protein
LIALYEVIVRIFPTSKNWSILNKLIVWLKLISDKLNNTTK